MKKQEDKIYLMHILDAINKIEEYVSNIDYNDFLENDMRSDAVIR